jgi:hypothetical protein
LGSQIASSPVRHSRWVHAIRSCAIQRQLEPHGIERELAEREVLKPGLFRAADPVLGIPTSAMQPLDLDHVAGEVGERRLEAVPVGVGELQLRAGVWALAADNHSRPVRPRREIQPLDMGDLGDLRALALLPVLTDRRTPSVLGQLQDRLAHAREQIEPNQERDVRVLRGLAERAGRARGVDPHHDLSIQIRDHLDRQLRERHVEHIDLRLG